MSRQFDLFAVNGTVAAARLCSAGFVPCASIAL